jgi:uncharacterized protein YbjT (DUF2867 family)
MELLLFEPSLETWTVRKPKVSTHLQLFPPNSALQFLPGLKALGAEVVAADWENVKSLKKAFKGAWGIFGITGMSAPYILSPPDAT